MRKVIKDYTNVPGSIQHGTTHNKRLIKIYNGGVVDSTKIYEKIYRAVDVTTKLSRLYHNKCAYCETEIVEFEVEHYRPKGGISDDPAHNGYFWLCYEWSNLLPACHDCNKTSSKGSKFPIEGIRVQLPVIRTGFYQFADHSCLARRLSREYPLLFNPEEHSYQPLNFFKFDGTGFVSASARKNTRTYRRANRSIDDIRLNRDDLYLVKRKYLLRSVEKRIKSIFLLYLKNYLDFNKVVALSNLRFQFRELLNELKDNSKPTHEFSFFWGYMLDNFNLVVDRAVKPKHRTLFLDLVRDYKLARP